MSQPGIIQINFPPKTKITKREPPTPQLFNNQLHTPITMRNKPEKMRKSNRNQ
jgi:hypothetical protein